MKNLINFLAVLLLASCGGGSSGASQITGTYNGDLVLTRNTCSFADEDIKAASYEINQSSNLIAVQNKRLPEINYAGTYDNDGTFTATRTTTTTCTRSGTAQVVLTFDFTSIDDGGEVSITTAYGRCGSSLIPGCETVHQGFLVKQD